MPLNSTDFVPQGPIRSADLQQFVNLLTGVMTDQPVTLKNAVTIGSSQSTSTAPLKVYGAAGQTGDLIDLYPSPASNQPTFGLNATGKLAWGPGGTSVQDTFLSRIGTQNGHATDTAGLLIQPNLEVPGTIYADGPLTFTGGGSIQGSGANTLQITQNLNVPGNVYVGGDNSTYLHQVQSGVLGIDPTLVVHGANAAGTGLGIANAHLQVRSDDLNAGAANDWHPGFSVQTWMGNWLQFNTRFQTVTANQGWGGCGLALAFDVDSSMNAGGWIGIMGQKVGINGWPSGGQAFQVNGDLAAQNATVNGVLTMGQQIHMPPNVAIYWGDTNHQIYSDGGNMMYFDNWATFQWRSSSRSFAGTMSLDTNGNLNTAGDVTITGGDLYLGTRHIYDQPGGSGGIHVDYDFRVDGAHDVFTHNIHLVANSGDCNIGSASGQMDYYGPNGSTNHRFFHIDTSWMGCQAANFSSQSTRESKADAQTMTDAACIDAVRHAMDVVTWQSPNMTNRSVGVYAEDLAPILPEGVDYNADGSLFGVQYPNLTAVLWGALRNVDLRLQALESRSAA